MDIETLNPYVIKILIAAREQDSISAIAQRIDLSYGWTYKWVKRLIQEGVFKEKWKGIILQKNNKFYRETLDFVKEHVSKHSFFYTVLPLFGISYCFTKTDAVYIWTEGGYNIARYKSFYPIFIKIKAEDCPTFLWYCKKLHLPINAKKGVFYSPDIVPTFSCAQKGNYAVEPLQETIRFMRKYIYNFEPALEMIDELYNTGLKARYREIKT